jgi:two-component system chemotaxis response regulator CheB
MHLVAMGASLGGLKVLSGILPTLPRDLTAAVVIVQHRKDDSDSSLDTLLSRRSTWPVSEPCHGEPISAGRVYLAPAGYHLLVEPGTFAMSMQETVRCARPSIDVLLESAAHAYRQRAIGVLLTGSNADGAAGAALIRDLGGTLIVQDPSTAEAPECPRAALARVPDALVLSPNAIAAKLGELCRRAGS